MINKILTFAMCCLFLNIAAQAQGLPSEQPKQTDVKAAQKLTAKDYDDLLAKLKKGDTAIDFTKLRFAYAETKDYSPYGIGADEKKALFDAFNGKKYEEALKKAEEILKTNYVEMNAHFVAFVSNQELGKSEKSEFHRKVFTGLINSILDGADGKTAKTAYKVICVPEEYVVLNFLGLRRTSQALTDENGSKFDILTVVDNKTNESAKLYFNIDTVWKGYEKVLGK